jgi:hypothetical protein
MLVEKLLPNVGKLDKGWVVDIMYDVVFQDSRWTKQ